MTHSSHPNIALLLHYTTYLKKNLRRWKFLAFLNGALYILHYTYSNLTKTGLSSQNGTCPPPSGENQNKSPLAREEIFSLLKTSLESLKCKKKYSFFLFSCVTDLLFFTFWSIVEIRHDNNVIAENSFPLMPTKKLIKFY